MFTSARYCLEEGATQNLFTKMCDNAGRKNSTIHKSLLFSTTIFHYLHNYLWLLYLYAAGFEGDDKHCHQRLNTSSVESNTPEQNYVEDSCETTGDIDPHSSGDGHQGTPSCKNEVEIHTHPPLKKTPMRLISELARNHKVSNYYTNIHCN